METWIGASNNDQRCPVNVHEVTFISIPSTLESNRTSQDLWLLVLCCTWLMLSCTLHCTDSFFWTRSICLLGRAGTSKTLLEPLCLLCYLYRKLFLDAVTHKYSRPNWAGYVQRRSKTQGLFLGRLLDGLDSWLVVWAHMNRKAKSVGMSQ